MIQVGFDNISRIYVGSDEVDEVYYGSEKVWTGRKGYWVHKDTGVKTYFRLGDTSHTNGVMDPPSWRRDCSEVRIPFGISGLGTNCFSSCPSLTSITLPVGVNSLGHSCFYNCTSLASINIPESVGDVISLGDMCFRFCSSLASINIPEGVNVLGTNCFNSCTSLTSITLPESLTTMGYACFYNCTSLTLVTVLPATPPSLSSNSFTNTPTSLNIKVHAPYVNAYKTATYWKNYADKISAI